MSMLSPTRPDRTPRRPAARALALVVLLVVSTLTLVAAPIAGQGSEGEPGPSEPMTDESTPGVTWSLDVSDAPGGATVFENVGEDGPVTERLVTRFHPGNATLEHAYRWDQGTGEDRPFPNRAPTARSNATVQIAAVYVFHDTDGDEIYQLGDEILSYHRISRATVHSQALDLPNPLRGVAASYDLGDGAELTVNLYTTDERTWYGNRLVDPSELELNLTLTGLESDRPDTFVGLQLTVEGTGGLQAASQAFEYRTPGAKTTLRWAELAHVDDSFGQVGATVLERKTAGQTPAPNTGWVVLSTPASDQVDLGVTLVSLDVPPGPLADVVNTVLGNLPIYLAGLAGAAGLVGLSIYMRLREDGRTGRRGRGPSQEA